MWSSKQPLEYGMINLSIPFVQSLNLEFSSASSSLVVRISEGAKMSPHDSSLR